MIQNLNLLTIGGKGEESLTLVLFKVAILTIE